MLRPQFHPGGRHIQPIQRTDHITEVVLRAQGAIGQSELTRGECKCLRVHNIEHVLERLRDDPDAAELFEVTRHAALLRHVHQVRPLRILLRVARRRRSDIHARGDELLFVGDFQAGKLAVTPETRFEDEELALMRFGFNRNGYGSLLVHGLPSWMRG
ncbi:hypothetical protein D3C87_1708720 [compost metagenome]